jgi:hypothetical protein
VFRTVLKYTLIYSTMGWIVLKKKNLFLPFSSWQFRFWRRFDTFINSRQFFYLLLCSVWVFHMNQILNSFGLHLSALKTLQHMCAPHCAIISYQYEESSSTYNSHYNNSQMLKICMIIPLPPRSLLRMIHFQIQTPYHLSPSLHPH